MSTLAAENEPEMNRKRPSRLTFELVFWGNVVAAAVGIVGILGWLLWRIVERVS
jgi:hypothetical protein